jgi:enolase
VSATIISFLHAWEALDSRGRPTVACRVGLAGGCSGRAITPSGASTGGHEAHELRDGGARYEGLGVRNAVAHANELIARELIGRDAEDRVSIDHAIESLDADSAMGTIGANAALAVSLAVTLARAEQQGQPVWRSLGASSIPLVPMPMVNIVSGGAHAGSAIDVQDVLVVPVAAETFREAIEWVSRVRAATAGLMEKRGYPTALVADEGGLAGAFSSNEEALQLVNDGIAAAGFVAGDEVAMAVDFAANQLWDGDGYRLRLEARTLSPEEWLDEIVDWCERYPIISLEDVLHEDDWQGWAAAERRLGSNHQLLGDDHFATNLARLERRTWHALNKVSN